MNNYDPPYKTLFFVCYSAVAAIFATEAGLIGNSDSYAVSQSYDALAFGDEWWLDFKYNDRYYNANDSH